MRISIIHIQPCQSQSTTYCSLLFIMHFLRTIHFTLLLLLCSPVTVESSTFPFLNQRKVLKLSFTSENLHVRSFLNDLRSFASDKIEYVTDSEGRPDVFEIVVDGKDVLDYRRIDPDTMVSSGSRVDAIVSANFSECTPESCRFCSVTDLIEFLNSIQAKELFKMTSLQAKTVNSFGLNYWVNSTFVTVFAFVMAVLMAFCFRFAVMVRRAELKHKTFVATKLNGIKILPVVKEYNPATPLHDALSSQLDPMVSIPEEWKRFIKTITPEGKSCIHSIVGAIPEKSESAVLTDLTLFLAFDFDLNVRDNSGHTPLHLAVISHRPSVVTSLLSHDADPNYYNAQQLTPLALAIKTKSLDCMKALLAHRKTAVNATIEMDNTALKMSIKYRESRQKFFDVLMCDPRIDYNATGDNIYGAFHTPLHTAVMSGNIRALKLLVMKGANLSAKDCDNKMPLMLAIELDSAQMAQLLIPLMNPRDFTDNTSRQNAIEAAIKKNTMPEIAAAMEKAVLELDIGNSRKFVSHGHMRASNH